MPRRWSWFGKPPRAESTQSVADAAQRDERIVREELDDYLRDTFSDSPPPRVFMRRLPLGDLDDQRLYPGSRQPSFLREASRTDTGSQRAGMDPETGEPPLTATTACDCTEQSSCPHASSSRRSSNDQSDEAIVEKGRGSDESRADNDKAIQVDRSAFLLSRSSQTDTPGPSDVEERVENPVKQRVSELFEEPVEEQTAGSSAETALLSESTVVETDTQTDLQFSQQTVVRVLPGPSGMPTIVIESTGPATWSNIAPDTSHSRPQMVTANVGVQVRAEQLVAEAGEATGGNRKGRQAADRQPGRGKTPRVKLEIPKAKDRGASQAQEAPARDDGSRSPGSMRWSEWDDKQSPWVAADKYTIRDTTEESVDPSASASRSPSYTQDYDRRIAEESLQTPARGPSRVVLRESREVVLAGVSSGYSLSESRCSSSNTRPTPTPTPGPSPLATSTPPRAPTVASSVAHATPTTPTAIPGANRHIKRHDCTGQLRDRSTGGYQPPK